MPKDILVMSVGPSGVGKSTIGNRLLGLKKKDTTYLNAEPAAHGVTTETTTVKSGRYSYTDVPGIPDPVPQNTKKYYNMIIKEAKKPCTAIFIVFGVNLRMDPPNKDRIKQCALLFDEINQSSAAKILILNDMMSTYSPSAEGLNDDDDDYEEEFKKGKKKYDERRKESHAEYEKDIRELTGIKFHSTAVLYGLSKKENPTNNMATVLETIKHKLQEFECNPSPHLRSFEELEAFVLAATATNAVYAMVYGLKQAKVHRLEAEYASLKFKYDTAVGVSEAAKKQAKNELANWLSLGTNWLANKSVEGGGAAAATLIQLAMLTKLSELNEARSEIDKDNFEKTLAEYKVKLERFENLKKLLEAAPKKEE